MTAILSNHLEKMFRETGSTAHGNFFIAKLMPQLTYNLLKTELPEKAVWPARPKLRVSTGLNVEYPDGAKIPVSDKSIQVDIIKNNPVQVVKKSNVIIKLTLEQLELLFQHLIEDVFNQLDIEITSN